MNQLTIFEKDGNLWTDSREVAAMIGKEHKNLLRDIGGYMEAMRNSNELKIEPVEFFRESTYLDSKGEARPCYAISKKGCEFVANKLTGERGVLFTAVYVNQFNDYEKALAAPRTTPAERLTRAKAMLINAKRRAAQDYRRLYEAAGISPAYQIMALQDYMGVDGPRLPAAALASAKVTYDKGTIAKRLGVYSRTGLPHAQAVGAVIGKLDVAAEDMERVPFTRNGHDGFDVQYTERVVAQVGGWLEAQGYPDTILGGGKTFHVSYERRGAAS